MKLAELVRRCGGVSIPADNELEVRDLCVDSRLARVGSLFVALPGSKADGSAFVADALARGAVAVLTPHELDLRTVISQMPGLQAVQWLHPRARALAGEVACLLAGEPTATMRVVGITGTNGKTTTAHITGELLRRGGLRPAVLGTAGHVLEGGEEIVARHTTPDAPELWRLLALHQRRGGASVVMEVSSHALEQERVAGLDFEVAVFTNLTREHLDYHKDMANYARAKARLFEGLRPGATAVLNLDDPHWVQMAASARASGAAVCTYSTRASADLCATRLSPGPQGTRVELEGLGLVRAGVMLGLRGRYNVENALAAAASALSLGVSAEVVLAGLAESRGAPGRLERVTPVDHPFQVLVDYAHSPDALERVLQALRAELDASGSGGNLVVVFGCGGDRDRGKRPQMGRAAEELADVVWLTSDNPRSEDPEAIVAEILTGMQRREALHLELDRRAAIAAALAQARPGDLVLIAGKGHETFQWIGNQALAFDDRQVVREVLS